VDAAIEQVRSFNRVVTRRIGALEDTYLATGRPLGASRTLWEIGRESHPPTDLRALRARLDLDSGYLSRLVAGLEREGLVERAPAAGDRRVRAVRLTQAGRAERARLDAASDALASSLLEPLGDGQRQRLVEAMATVERLLTAGLVEVAPEDPASAAAQACLAAYFAEIDERFETGWDQSVGIRLEPADMAPPRGLLLLARLHGEAVGCGVLWHHGGGVADAKRMWVAPRARGLGLGRRLLSELERHARAAGVRTLRLDTNRALTEAIGLYRAAGYEEIERFNDEPHAHHWFAKSLG
jgi:DNA-binding MarR family transcriptional regulator/ribosomal protein S18 acetylase RimI-like enzyme